MLNVIFDATCLLRTRQTGIGKYAFNLATALQKLDCKLQPIVKGSRYLKIFSNDNPLVKKAKPYWPGVTDVMLPKNAVFHGPDFKIISSACRPRIVTIHDLAVFRTDLLNPDFCKPGQERIHHLLAQNPDGIIVPTQFVASELIKLAPDTESKIKVIPHGADHHDEVEFSPNNTGKNYFLYVGTIEKRKNLKNLIRAFELFCKTNKDLKLVLVGGGGYGSEEIFDQIKSSEVSNFIEQKGYIGDVELTDLYRKAKAMVYPSHYEGFGIPVIEAMTHGCPIITSKETSTAEVAGSAALLVDPNSPEEISQAMNVMSSSQENREELILKGIERVRSFTWERCARETLEFYKQVSL